MGARLRTGPARGVQLLLKGDIGGFGVTYSKGFRVDVLMSGPLVGLSILFPS